MIASRGRKSRSTGKALENIALPEGPHPSKSLVAKGLLNDHEPVLAELLRTEEEGLDRLARAQPESEFVAEKRGEL